jgi:hypothetical protein
VQQPSLALHPLQQSATSGVVMQTNHRWAFDEFESVRPVVDKILEQFPDADHDKKLEIVLACTIIAGNLCADKTMGLEDTADASLEDLQFNTLRGHSLIVVLLTRIARDYGYKREPQ